MNIHPDIVQGWSEQLFNEMVQVHGENHITMDKFARHYRIKQDEKILVYIHHTTGWMFRPCHRGRVGPNKSGQRGGIMYDLSKGHEREDCIRKIQLCGRMYDGYVIDDNLKNAVKYCESLGHS